MRGCELEKLSVFDSLQCSGGLVVLSLGCLKMFQMLFSQFKNLHTKGLLET